MLFWSIRWCPCPIARANHARAAKPEPASNEATGVNLDTNLEDAVIGGAVCHVEPLTVDESILVDFASDAELVAVESESSCQACPKVADGRVGLAK